MTKPLASLRRSGITTLRKYRDAPASDRTPLLRALAEILVDAREQFLGTDGEPDLRGRSYAYRSWLTDIYNEAGIPKDEHSSVSAAARYHANLLIRQRYPADEIKAIGLKETSAIETARDYRARRSALLSALTSKDIQGGALLNLSAAWGVFSRIDPNELEGLEDEARETAQIWLQEIAARTETLLKRVNAEDSAGAKRRQGRKGR